MAQTQEQAFKVARELGLAPLLEPPTKEHFWLGKIDPCVEYDLIKQEKAERKEKKRLERLAERERLKKEIEELKALRKEKKDLERGGKK